jgi:uncharacterized protein (TIGR02996 family)
MKALTDAEAALDAGDREGALDALLVAWREQRSPILASIIDIVSGDLSRSVPPLSSEPLAPAALDKAWRDREGAKLARDMPVLLPGLFVEPKSTLLLRLTTLVARGADPRLGEAMVRMIEDPPATASSNFGLWTKLFATLPTMVDTTVRPRLESRARRKGGKSQFWPKLQGWIKAVIPKLPEPVKLDAAAAKVAAVLEKKARKLAATKPQPLGTVVRREKPAAGIDTLVAAARESNWPAVLDGLVTMWGERRLPTLSAAILEVDALLPRSEEVLDWTTAPTLAPRDRGRALRDVLEGTKRAAEVRLPALLEWSPDPRVARWAFGTRLADVGARPVYWSLIHDIMLRHFDPERSTEVLAYLDQAAQPSAWQRRAVVGASARRTLESFKAAAKKTYPMLTTSESAAVDQIRELAGATGAKARTAEAQAVGVEDGFLERIVAAPTDDTALRVYADWLMERQDPRGDAIVMSLDGKAQPLNAKSVQSLLGVLGKTKDGTGWVSGATFQRGLLATASTQYNRCDLADPATRARIVTSPHWATVRRITFDYDHTPFDEFFTEARLWSLEELQSVTPRELAALSRRQSQGKRPAPLVRASFWTDIDEANLGEDFSLPTLAELTVTMGENPPRAFYERAWVRKLKRCRFEYWYEREWASVVRAFATLCPLPRIELERNGTELALTKRADGLYDAAIDVKDWPAAGDLDAPRDAPPLANLPADIIASATVKLDGMPAATLQHFNHLRLVSA